MSDLTIWLGPAAQLTPEQRERFDDEARAVEARYPDPDDFDRCEAALSATVQHLLGDVTPDEAARNLINARIAEGRAFAAAVQVAVMLVHDGEPKATSARRCGIDRMSLLAALGER